MDSESGVAIAPSLKTRFARLTIGDRGEIIQTLADYAIDIAIIGRPPADLDLSRALIGVIRTLYYCPAQSHGANASYETRY